MNNDFLKYNIRQESAEILIWLLEISHSSISTLRFARNTEDITHNSNIYTALGFDITPPQQFDDEPSASLIIDNVGLDFISFFQNIDVNQEDVKITIKAVLSSNPDIVQRQYDLIASDLTLNNMNMTIKCISEKFLNLAYGKLKFNPVNFPGMF